MDLFKIVEEEVKRTLEGSDVEIVLGLIEAYRSSGPRGARDKLREILSRWGIDVGNIED
ncbi:MAG: hypothetical protein ABWJ97_00580 [Thermoproteus sp.]